MGAVASLGIVDEKDDEHAMEMKEELANKENEITDLKRQCDDLHATVKELEGERIRASELTLEREVIIYEKEELQLNVEKLKFDVISSLAEIEAMNFHKINLKQLEDLTSQQEETK